MKRHAILAFIRNILLTSALTGGVSYLIFYGWQLDFEGLLYALFYGTFYSAVMWCAQCLALVVAMRYMPLRTRRDLLLRAALHGIALLLSFLLATWLLRLLLNPGFLSNTGTMVTIGVIAFAASAIGNGAYYMGILNDRLRRAESAALAAELAALRARIDPHFLFNSLNSIAALIRIDPRRAEELTESLADLFRYSLRTSEQPTVSLAEELASVELYLAIERARFGGRLRVTIAVPEDLTRAQIPSLTLQPLVENAVKHGLGATNDPFEITIEASRRDGDLLLLVRDTGPGFATTDLEELARRGKGLGNVRDRLRHEFGDAARMAILPNGVELRIPHRSGDAAASEGKR